MLPDGHPGEQHVEVGGDHLLEGHEPLTVGHDHETGKHRRDLHPGDALLAGPGVAHLDQQVEREVRDVGEGVAGVDGQGGEDREDLPMEDVDQVGAVVVVEGRPVREAHPGLGQRRGQPVREPVLAGHELLHPGADDPELLAGPQAVDRPGAHARRHLVVEPATRTWKSSSSSSEKMAMNLIRSSSGTDGSSERSRRRAPKSGATAPGWRTAGSRRRRCRRRAVARGSGTGPAGPRPVRCPGRPSVRPGPGCRSWSSAERQGSPSTVRRVSPRSIPATTPRRDRDRPAAPPDQAGAHHRLPRWPRGAAPRTELGLLVFAAVITVALLRHRRVGGQTRSRLHRSWGSSWGSPGGPRGQPLADPQRQRRGLADRRLLTASGTWSSSGGTRRRPRPRPPGPPSPWASTSSPCS